MIKKWGTWLGIEHEHDVDAQRSQTKPEEWNKEETDGVTALACDDDPLPTTDHLTAQILQRAKGFGGYIYNVASDASKKLSVSVVETAQTLKKSVEEGHIDGIIDKTILGEFQKEQERFVQEKNANQFCVAVPPWVGFNDEENIQQQILALSADKRNFLREPPTGIRFPFDFQQMSPVAMTMLEEDELLSKMRFHLVPKQMTEEAFWRNYFYRVSLIKQSAQISLLAAQRPQTPETQDHPDPDQHKEEDVVPDWEKELHEELQVYELVAGAENHNDRWDKELEDMLREDL